MWTSPPSHLEISTEEVHLWRVALSQPSAIVRGFEPLLSPDEVRRASRYRAELLRARFVVGRGALRVILGRYLALAADRVSFRYGEHGKPALGSNEWEHGLHFNIAHSDDLAVMAIASGRGVGIDVERIRPMDDADRIVSRFFSECERSAFFALPDERRLEAFFRGWTRKEAYLKAIGMGLGMPLDAFDVSIAPEEPPRLLRVSGRPDEPSRWSLRDFSEPGFLGSVAVEGIGWRLAGFRYEPTDVA